VVGVGGHTILVEQQGPQGTLRDATTFIIPLLDSEEEEEQKVPREPGQRERRLR
jgi:hypothetical protein